MYVISVKRVRDIFGAALLTPEWEYACYDNFSGPLSTGFPIFSGLHHALFFQTEKDAEEWYNVCSKYINFSGYDEKSLAIRKVLFKNTKIL